MPETQDYGDYRHLGQHRFDEIVLPAECVGDTQFDPDDPLAVASQRHEFAQRLSQAHGTAAADERRVVHVAAAAGTVLSFRAGPVVAAVGDSTVTADLRKNGSTVLSGVVSIDSGDAAYAVLAGSVSGGSAAYSAGDVFEVILDATVGTGTLPQGVWAEVILDEGPA